MTPVAESTAVIFDIQRFSLHDGPGIRTVVFFKGCNLRCLWCQNPEGIHSRPELSYFPERCVPGCQGCVDVCARGALSIDVRTRVSFAQCDSCGHCTDICPADALRLVGRHFTQDELLASVSRDRGFYAASGGGLTLSGGEPVLAADFLASFLPQAQARGFHIVLETAGYYPYEMLDPLLAHIDLVLFDLKAVDPACHRRLTGRTNELILENLATLTEARRTLQVRMPIIPGFNTDQVVLVAQQLRWLGIGEITLLPYHSAWERKIARLRTTQRPLGIGDCGDSELQHAAEQFASYGILARPVTL